MNVTTDTNGKTETLTLHIPEGIVLDYLGGFEREEWPARVEQALKVGVLAIQSAAPALDARIVEQKFAVVQEEIRRITEAFRDSVDKRLQDHFDKEKGNLPVMLQKLLGEKGELRATLEQYFASEGGQVSRLLGERIGPSSDFANKFDPNHADGVIGIINAKVQAQLDQMLQRFCQEFSLDKPDSALARLKAGVEKEIQRGDAQQHDAIERLTQSLGKNLGKEIESKRGTAKGREFQETMHAVLAELARGTEDRMDYVADVTGEIPRSKVGDSVAVLGANAGAPGTRIVFEAKKSSYTLVAATDELAQAKKNRKAEFGVFVFCNGYEPKDVGPFRIDDGDIFCVLDEEGLARGEAPIYLEAAFRIARTFAVKAERRQQSVTDGALLSKHMANALTSLNKFSELKTKTAAAKKSLEAVDVGLGDLRDEIKKHLDLADSCLQ